MTLSQGKLRASRCAPARRSPKRWACRVSGTVLGFRLQAAGEVRVTVQRRGRGRALRATRISAGAGHHRMRLLASRPLPPGRYTIRVRATSEGWAAESAARRLLVLPRG